MEKEQILTKSEYEELVKAKIALEHPSLIILLSDLIGMPVEIAVEMIPQKYREKITKITHEILVKMVEWASNPNMPIKSHRGIQIAVSLSGFIGGAFGIPTTILELPLSTFLILKDIVITAEEHGANIRDIKTRLECVSIFAMGSPKTYKDDAGEIGYYAFRLGFARMVEEAAEHIITKGLTREAAPAIVRFLTVMAERLGITLTAEVAVQVLPLVGAIGGVAINNIFLNHFHRVANAHFFIRKLERKYGEEKIKKIYEEIAV